MATPIPRSVRTPLSCPSYYVIPNAKTTFFISPLSSMNSNYNRFSTSGNEDIEQLDDGGECTAVSTYIAHAQKRNPRNPNRLRKTFLRILLQTFTREPKFHFTHLPSFLKSIADEAVVESTGM
jgi:hypothetical protein